MRMQDDMRVRSFVKKTLVKKHVQETFYRLNNQIASWKTNEKNVAVLVARRVWLVRWKNDAWDNKGF